MQRPAGLEADLLAAAPLPSFHIPIYKTDEQTNGNLKTYRQTDRQIDKQTNDRIRNVETCWAGG